MKRVVLLYGMAFLALMASLAMVSSCSDLRTQLPTPSSGELKVHPTGWTTEGSPNFHGEHIRKQSWDMRPCQPCHGLYYDGGTAQVSCRTCHNKVAGPENCTTCHGGVNSAPPRDLSRNTMRTARGVGAHQIHVFGGAISSSTPCTECHVVPGGVYDPGHIDADNRAEITFGDRLANTRSGNITPIPAYDYQSFRCSNTYCHGNFKNGNPGNTVVWNDVSGTQAACGTCHGDVTKPTLAERALPKTAAEGGTHPNALPCYGCHVGVVNEALQIIDKTKHINGKLNVFGIERDF